jgi:hypothetical protein
VSRAPLGRVALAAVCATVAALAAGAGGGLAGARAPAGPRLVDVAHRVGLDFRHGAFRFGVSWDPVAMMGGGLCWIDYDRDGWLDLFAVNSYSTDDVRRWRRAGGLPTSALFANVRGRFVNVTARTGAGLPVRGNGCVAADLDGNGYSDLVVTTGAGVDLLWNDGSGHFTEGSRAAGLDAGGWFTGAAVADVDGDGRPDLFVAGYDDLSRPLGATTAGFPGTYAGVRDVLYLNRGRGRDGRTTFAEVGRQAGLEVVSPAYGLGAVFTDYNGDGRPDLYVANDTNPNRLYENVAWPGGARADPLGLGFRFEERAAPEGVADPNAGMGIAAADQDGDGRTDLFVSNSRGQPHAVYRRQPSGQPGPAFADARPDFAAAFTRSSTGWGASWVDLDNGGDLDLVLANGAIPVRNLEKDAERIQVVGKRDGVAADVSASLGVDGLPRVVGRGVAAADVDNDGRVEIAVSSIGGRLLLLRPTGPAGHWLDVSLQEFRPGALVTAVLPDGRRLVREVQAGSSYLSSEDPRIHFGLGEATRVARLSVRFPGGGETELTNVRSDRIVSVGPPAPYLRRDCTRASDSRSVARIWDETTLDAIRRDVPAPTVNARNLFHVSAAMWDAWAAYDPRARGYFVAEKHGAADVRAAREAAISYAAYRILLWRYAKAASIATTFAELRATMERLCYRPDFTVATGDSPAALGNRIARAVIAYGLRDGSLEQQHYVDPSFVPANAPLIVSRPGAILYRPSLWQPLALDQIVTQNGVPVPNRVQSFVGAQWGHVRAFALSRSKRGLPVDPGKPPIGTATSAAYKRAALDVIRLSGALDPADGATIDIGLDARGDNPLGTNDGHGYDANPVTGDPYAPEVVPAADFGRAIAEFWADGPNSETPPGHWNVLANAVSDAPALQSRIGGGAAQRLRWDVRLYFTLNGAMHDAAIAAWGAKRVYESVRPISMIRYLAGMGQSSDRSLPSYSLRGLPLIPGVIELITAESSAAGQRHAALAGHVGEIAIRSWRPAGTDGAAAAGVGWILGTEWVPYQKPTFVTPAFPGFVSGHSTFSRAAAEVLTAFTGSRYFPGGEFDVPIAADALQNESGPSAPLTLRWASYYDAADQAGLSRLYGGIHIAADDFAGRRLGSLVGKRAWTLAQRYFDGTATARAAR